ncbi:MAG: hypothetical protein HY360_04270 [Verrucomicrobia bacterium]|nr:hypothetical protein [Verrucomicrobiota bacterium]
MRYVKQKREQVGACTICNRICQLTYDHIPPSVAGNADSMMLISALSAISGTPQEDRPLISQNGYKIRSICRDCNSTIGREYDQVMGQLCADINKYLASPLTLPAEAAFDTTPSRLLRGLLGHILAAKLSPDKCVVDKQIREYLANHTSTLHPDLHVYYWLYPYPSIVVFRDFVMALHTGNGREFPVCSVMKFPPLGMLLTNAKQFYDLPDLSTRSYFHIDAPARIPLRFDNLKSQDWPEGARHSTFIITGQSGAQSLHGTPRKS